MQTLQLACALACPTLANSFAWGVGCLVGFIALEVGVAFLVARHDRRGDLT